MNFLKVLFLLCALLLIVIGCSSSPMQPLMDNEPAMVPEPEVNEGAASIETQPPPDMRLQKQMELPAYGEILFDVVSELPAHPGDSIVVSVKLANVDNMFGCGFDLAFDTGAVSQPELVLRDIFGALLRIHAMPGTQQII